MSRLPGVWAAGAVKALQWWIAFRLETTDLIVATFKSLSMCPHVSHGRHYLYEAVLT